MLGKKNKRVFVVFFSFLNFFIFLVAVFIFYLSLKENGRRSFIENEINAMVAEKEKIQNENRFLEEKIAYLKTSQFQEKIAKEKLNLQKEGERVAIIKLDNLENLRKNEEQKKEKEIIIKKNNFERWRNYFFEEE